MTIVTNPIMTPTLETPIATATRLRSRLRDLYPATQFTVALRPAGTDDDEEDAHELVVSWTGAPTVPEVLPHANLFARYTARGEQLDATHWAGPDGKLTLIYPGAQRVRLQHQPKGEQ